MISKGWVHQAFEWFNPPRGVSEFSPLSLDLRGLSPMLIQVGEEEILLSDSVKLAAHVERSGVACHLEVYLERWHVFHLQAFYLSSSRQAVRAMAAFVRRQVP